MSDWWSKDPVVSSGPLDVARSTANWWQNDPVASPEDAMKKAAAEQVTKDRAGGGIGQTIGEGVRTFVNGIGMGFADEIGAGMNAAANFATGGRIGKPYDEALAYERAYDTAVENDQGMMAPALKIAGGLATVPVLPVAAPFSRGIYAPGMARTAGDAALNAGAYSAIAGFGEGQGGFENRKNNALAAGAVGAPLGAVGGAALSRMASRAQGTPIGSVVRDAQDVGVTLPQFMEGSQHARTVAAKMGAIPFVGDDINTAVNMARADTGRAAERLSARTGGGAGPQVAGEGVRDALVNWTTRGARAVQERAYRPVDTLMRGRTGQLTETATEVQRLLNEAASANNNSIGAAAIREVYDAATNPNGLTFQGIRRLRTRVGGLIDDALNPDARTDRAALQAVYGALSRDMEDMIVRRGLRAQMAWRRANNVARQVAERRDALTKVVGRDGGATGESVVDRIVRIAGSTSSGDAATLVQARRAAGPQVWRSVAGEAILRLGRNSADQFSPDTFVTKLSALSPAGRNMLFGSLNNPQLERQLNSLYNVSASLQQYSRLGNPSGTGGVAALVGALGAAASGDMGATLGTAVGGRLIGSHMSRPAQIQAPAANAQRMQRMLQDPRVMRTISAVVATISRELDGEED